METTAPGPEHLGEMTLEELRAEVDYRKRVLREADIAEIVERHRDLTIERDTRARTEENVAEIPEYVSTKLDDFLAAAEKRDRAAGGRGARARKPRKRNARARKTGSRT